jgi:hypothetical protein
MLYGEIIAVCSQIHTKPINYTMRAECIIVERYSWRYSTYILLHTLKSLTYSNRAVFPQIFFLTQDTPPLILNIHVSENKGEGHNFILYIQQLHVSAIRNVLHLLRFSPSYGSVFSLMIAI